VGGASIPTNSSARARTEKKQIKCRIPHVHAQLLPRFFSWPPNSPAAASVPYSSNLTLAYINKPRDQAAQQTHAKNTTPPGCREKSQRSCATIIKKEEHRQALAPFPVFRKPSWHKPATWKMVSTSFIGKRHG
jgi:hypothetical protein